MMYPQAVVAFVALVTNETNIRKYILAFSAVGILVAAYHILLQMFPTAFQCNDEIAKCSAVQFAQFGYITIPVMSFSFFLLIILVSLLTFDWKRKK
jgi:disulfide bond formation protein DsbB